MADGSEQNWTIYRESRYRAVAYWGGRVLRRLPFVAAITAVSIAAAWYGWQKDRARSQASVRFTLVAPRMADGFPGHDAATDIRDYVEALSPPWQRINYRLVSEGGDGRGSVELEVIFESASRAGAIALADSFLAALRDDSLAQAERHELERQNRRRAAMLLDAEDRLRDFQRAHAATLPNALGYLVSRRSVLQSEQARLELVSAHLSPALAHDGVRYAPWLNAEQPRERMYGAPRFEGRLAALAEQRHQIAARMVVLDRQIAHVPATAHRLRRMRDRVGELRAQLREGDDRLARDALASRIGAVAGAQIVQAPAGSPNPLTKGALIGGIAGALLALLMEATDRRLRRSRDLSRHTGEVPLAVLPYTKSMARPAVAVPRPAKRIVLRGLSVPVPFAAGLNRCWSRMFPAGVG